MDLEEEMMKMLTLLKLFVVLAVCCFGTAFADEGKDESGKGKGHPLKVQHGYVDEGDSYFHRHGYTRLEIPKGHYPPPGECRIWYPDRPAGHQPPPGKCRRLRTHVPPGAWLLHRPEDDPEHVQVIVLEERHPDTIQVIGEFDIGSGLFVRVVVD